MSEKYADSSLPAEFQTPEDDSGSPSGTTQGVKRANAVQGVNSRSAKQDTGKAQNGAVRKGRKFFPHPREKSEQNVHSDLHRKPSEKGGRSQLVSHRRTQHRYEDALRNLAGLVDFNKNLTNAVPPDIVRRQKGMNKRDDMRRIIARNFDSKSRSAVWEAILRAITDNPTNFCNPTGDSVIQKAKIRAKFNHYSDMRRGPLYVSPQQRYLHEVGEQVLQDIRQLSGPSGNGKTGRPQVPSYFHFSQVSSTLSFSQRWPYRP
ncbi:MAG: hypothetical protein K6C34_01645 [Alphaproteobacteria bacterium]|nr:hypothetical protein [Alphaproteobacteria bacterium]